MCKPKLVIFIAEQSSLLNVTIAGASGYKLLATCKWVNTRFCCSRKSI